jgi:hypothetical protein
MISQPGREADHQQLPARDPETLMADLHPAPLTLARYADG